MFFKHASILLAVSLSFCAVALPCPPVAGSVARRADGLSLGCRSIATRQDAPPSAGGGDASSAFDEPPTAPVLNAGDAFGADRPPQAVGENDTADDDRPPLGNAASGSPDFNDAIEGGGADNFESNNDGSDQGDQDSGAAEDFSDQNLDNQGSDDAGGQDDDGGNDLEERGERRSISLRQNTKQGKAGSRPTSNGPTAGKGATIAKDKTGNQGSSNKVFADEDSEEEGVGNDLEERSVEPDAPNVDALSAEAPLTDGADTSGDDSNTAAEAAFAAILTEICANAATPTVTVTSTVTIAAQETGISMANVGGQDAERGRRRS